MKSLCCITFNRTSSVIAELQRLALLSRQARIEAGNEMALLQRSGGADEILLLVAQVLARKIVRGFVTTA
jgi:hypothetical protein